MDVVHKLIICRLHVATSHRQTQHLFHRNLIVRFTSSTLVTMFSLLGQQGRELASLTQAEAWDLWDLPDQRL